MSEEKVKLLACDCGHIPNENGAPICGAENHYCWPIWDPWGCGSYCKPVKDAKCQKCIEIDKRNKEPAS